VHYTARPLIRDSTIHEYGMMAERRLLVVGGYGKLKLMSTLTPSRQTGPSTESVLAELADHGYRTTEPRRRVLAEVLDQDRPFTAEQIVARLPDIGRATVYRTLEILAGIDLLRRLMNPGGFPSYVVGQPGHRHHLVCKNCGYVIEFTTCPIDDLLDNLTRDTRFEIESHHLEITGLCPQCQALRMSATSN
jgi:Fur family transcriptional regulator, ferric uptake regulator